MLIFAKKPENDFQDFIDTYYEECRQRVSKIEAIAGKWEFADLIPGLSDFDTRFICAEDTSPEDFTDMSKAVGDAHLSLCRRHPKWSRMLEHLPGVNPTWAELTEDRSYYPEYQQWSFYRTDNPEKLSRAQGILDCHAWDERDEYFFLKKFYTYYGPYDRNIDPPINIGAYESKYPLHSRIMHYFNPPLQAALTLLRKKAVRGKNESFVHGRELLPSLPLWGEIERILALHYETPELYNETALCDFERRLFGVLDELNEMIRTTITILPSDARGDAQSIKQAIAQVAVSPQMRVFDASRFSRLFKGRMYFYANAPAHFDTTWLINHELNRIGNMFYREPYRIFWLELTGKIADNPDDILPELVPWLLTEAEAKTVLAFSGLAPRKGESVNKKKDCMEITALFDTVFFSLEKVKKHLDEIIGNKTPEKGG